MATYNTTYDQASHNAAIGTNALQGAMSGAASGLAVGPVGAVVGGLAGAAIGAGMGAWKDDTDQQARIKAERARKGADELAKVDLTAANKAVGRPSTTAPAAAGGFTGADYMGKVPVAGSTSYDAWKAGG